MITIENKDWGTLIWERLFLWEEAQKDRICLVPTKGEMMNYGESNTNVISFPWEYDINDVTIKCIDAGDLLHYVVHIEWTWIAILQSSAALEKENIEGIDQWIVANEEIKKEIENLELEGEMTVIGE